METDVPLDTGNDDQGESGMNGGMSHHGAAEDVEEGPTCDPGEGRTHDGTVGGAGLREHEVGREATGGGEVGEGEMAATSEGEMAATSEGEAGIGGMNATGEGVAGTGAASV